MTAIDHYGIILRDPKGNTWFCGGDSSVIGKAATGDEELSRVMPATSEISDDLDRIDKDGPAQGKFLMIPGDPLQLELIDWWEPVLHDGDDAQELRDLIARITARMSGADDPCHTP